MAKSHSTRPPDLEDIAAFLKPRLKLFLSVDLVGSTSFKQFSTLPLRGPRSGDTLRDLGAQWFNPIAEFYSQIEKTFFEEWKYYLTAVCTACHWPEPKNSPQFWKASGDELIYVLDLSDPRDAYAAVTAWTRTLRQFRQTLASRRSALDVKGAAWTAGFPISNVEVVFRYSSFQDDQESQFDQAKLIHYFRLEKWYDSTCEYLSKHSFLKDYVGPSMDLGFRIRDLSTHRKFAMTADVALLIASTPSLSRRERKKLPKEFFTTIKIRYDGRVNLTGVLGGQPYPLFWIDMLYDDQLHSTEDKLLTIKELSTEDVVAFCDEFFDTYSKYLWRPFMIGCDNSSFNSPPEDYILLLTEIHRLWKAEKERYQTEERAIGEEEPDPGIETEALVPNKISSFTAHITPTVDQPRNPTPGQPKKSRRRTGSRKRSLR